jgi:hypothetical protein
MMRLFDGPTAVPARVGQRRWLEAIFPGTFFAISSCNRLECEF